MDTLLNQSLVRQYCANIRWILGMEDGYAPGSFTEHIIKAFFFADATNYKKLSSLFPEIAKAYKCYMKGDNCYCKG